MKRKLTNTSVFIVLLMAVAFSLTATAKSGRSKVIDFEDEVIEGMNKRPLDSVSQLGDKDKRKKKAHLYRKRVGFRTETAETVKNLRYR